MKIHLRPLAILIFSVGYFTGASGEASIQTLNLTTGGAAGTALDSALPFVFAGVTLTASATSTSGTPAVNADATSLGVNIVGDGSDQAAEIDAAFGEELTFTFAFAPNITLTLLSLDLLGVGPATPADDAHIFKNASSLIDLHTLVPNFNGTTDVWTPAVGVPLANGDSLRFVAGNTFGLQGITFDVVEAAVPEPLSICVWMGGIAICLLRRDSK